MDGFAMDDLGGARARFACVAARWALDARAAAGLLGLSGDWSGRSLMEVVGGVGPDAEARMRLACDVDALLWRLVPDAEVADWLRSTGVGYEDENVTPLHALSSGAPALRALRRHLEEIRDSSRGMEMSAR